MLDQLFVADIARLHLHKHQEKNTIKTPYRVKTATSLKSLILKTPKNIPKRRLHAGEGVSSNMSKLAHVFLNPSQKTMVKGRN